MTHDQKDECRRLARDTTLSAAEIAQRVGCTVSTAADYIRAVRAPGDHSSHADERSVANVSNERKCVVCRCTDDRACDGGCEWIQLDPPLCSSCVSKYLTAKLWAFVVATEGQAKGELARAIRELRTLYSFLASDPAERFGIPTLRQVTEINRQDAKARAAAESGRSAGAKRATPASASRRVTRSGRGR